MVVHMPMALPIMTRSVSVTMMTMFGALMTASQQPRLPISPLRLSLKAKTTY